jgi:hypothetical protein
MYSYTNFISPYSFLCKQKTWTMKMFGNQGGQFAVTVILSEFLFDRNHAVCKLAL